MATHHVHGNSRSCVFADCSLDLMVVPFVVGMGMEMLGGHILDTVEWACNIVVLAMVVVVGMVLVFDR